MMPVRAYAKITAAKGGPRPVRITGSNDYMNIMAAVTYNNIEKPGAAMLQPGPLKGLLSTLPGDTTLEIETTDTHLRVTRNGGSPYTFLLESGDYPDPVEVREQKVSANLSFLGDALNAVRRSVDPDTKVVRVKSTNDTVTLHSTDGARLTQATVSNAGFGTFDSVLSTNALDAIVKINPSVIAFDKKAVNAASDEASLTVRSESIEFQDFTPILSRIPAHRVEVNRKEALEKLKRLHAVSPGSVVTLGISNDSIVLSLSGSLATYGQETLTVEDGPEELISISLNLEYLLDAISSHQGEKLAVGFSGPKEPFLIKSNNENMEVISVIMPVG